MKHNILPVRFGQRYFRVLVFSWLLATFWLDSTDTSSAFSPASTSVSSCTCSSYSASCCATTTLCTASVFSASVFVASSALSAVASARIALTSSSLILRIAFRAYIAIIALTTSLAPFSVEIKQMLEEILRIQTV